MISTWTLLFVLKYFGAGVTSQTSIYMTLEDCQKAGDLIKKSFRKDDPNFKSYTLCYQSNRIDVK